MFKEILIVSTVLLYCTNDSFARKATKDIIGADDHDYKIHEKELLGADNHDFILHGKKEMIFGGGDHDYKIHKKSNKQKLLGTGEHDFKFHGKTNKHGLIGAGDHDYKFHGKRNKNDLIGAGDHDYKFHGKRNKNGLFGAGDHDYKVHGKTNKHKLIGGGDHDYKFHGKTDKPKLIGGGDHDYKFHGKTDKPGLIGGGDHDYKIHGKSKKQKLIGGGDHDYKKHRKGNKNRLSRKHALEFIRMHCESKASYKKVASSPLLEDFVTFAKTFQKSYKGCKHLRKRLSIFNKNAKKIKFFQFHENGTAQYGFTKFADWTREEFSQLLGLKQDLKPKESHLIPAPVPEKFDAPNEFDWRPKGAVTPVKNQGMCGSCWAFSVTGNVEGQWALKHNKLYSLSEQELVDCDKSDEGCNGGYMENAYKAIEKLGGLETEKDYPYEGEDDACQFNKNKTVVKVSGGLSLSKDETILKQWLYQNGPISIGINANALQFYFGGVSHPLKFLCNPKNLDHGMLIVGYGVHTTKYLHRVQPYWLVKNSWGENWGEKGYYRVYRGDGTCGVNTDATSAIVP